MVQASATSARRFYSDIRFQYDDEHLEKVFAKIALTNVLSIIGCLKMLKTGRGNLIAFSISQSKHCNSIPLIIAIFKTETKPLNRP